jgi:hypothetical protein
MDEAQKQYMRVFYNSGKLGLARVQSFLIWATPAI